MTSMVLDDFNGLTQVPTQEELLHFTRAVVHGINLIFPPPGLLENSNNKPILVRKLKQEMACGAQKRDFELAA